MKKRVIAILMTAIMCCLQLAGFVPAEKVKAAYSVTEEDIYYRCPEYLDNKAYDNYMVRCEERIEKGMATINDAEGLGASILYSLQNGANIIISELASLAGIGQSTKDKLNKEVVYQLIQAYLSSDTSATDTASQIGNAYSTISDAYNVANATDLYNYKESLKSSSVNLSGNQVDKLVDMYTEADTFSKILGYAGDAQKAIKIITAYIEMQDMDLVVLNKLDDAFSSMDSEFSGAIRSIMSDRTSDFLTFAKKNYLQDEVIKKMVSVVAKYGSSPVLFVKNVCTNILGKIYKSFCPTADQIIQAGMCQAYTYLARNKVNQLRKEFKNGKASEDKIEQYKLVYGFYITTMKTTMDKVAGCVNGSDKSVKQALKSWAGSLSGFTYAAYMERCRSEASADVSAGRLKISGNTVTRKTSDGTTIDENYDSTESIKARLAAIKQKYPPNQGVTWKGDWGGARQCFGFARMVFYFLYGKNMPANYYPNACYQYQQNSGVNKVGQLTGNFTAAQVQQLFAQAKIGDVIQASITASSGQHTMIFTGLTSKGITVYDCNAAVNGCAPGGCGINEWERSYSELAKGTYGYGSSNGGITIYRADNYASIYGDGDDVFYDDSANFIIENGVLVKYTGWQPYVEIPDTVTAIGKEAFLNNKTMMYVLIPDSVKSIGESAFKGCTSLLSVSIPDSVESIGNSAFEGCTSMGYAYLPNNAKYTVIESGIFRECSALKEIELPDNIKHIYNYAFRNCINLNSVKMSTKLESLGWEVFGYCESLESIFIPKTLEKIGSDWWGQNAYDNGPFWGTSSLKNISFEQDITDIPERLFWGCTGLEELQLPETINVINASAFRECTSLKKVTLPARINKIDNYAFRNCDALTRIDLPDGIEKIGWEAFGYCGNLKTVILPEDVEIGANWWGQNAREEGPFVGDSLLTEVQFSENTTEIPAKLFSGCTGIEKVVIPSNVRIINESAFQNCTNLLNVELSKRLTAIQGNSFRGCGKLTDINFPASLKKIDNYAFWGDNSLEEIVLPDEIRTIGYGTFAYCSSLQSINIPGKVKMESDWWGVEGTTTGPFEYCSSLKKITINSNKEDIDWKLFKNCNGLESITIPETITEISDEAFCGCTKLQEVIFGNNSQLRKIGNNAFENCDNLSKIVIPEKVENIGEKAFYHCDLLESVKLNNRLNVLNSNIFCNCKNLKQIEFLDGLKIVGDGVFGNCYELKEVLLPKIVQKIGVEAFYNCDSLLSVNMQNNVLVLGKGVFYDCESLNQITLSAGIRKVPKETFRGCSSLESIILPYQVETIEDNAFKNCTKLRKITIPKATTSISDSAFSYPDKMTIYGVAGSYAEQYATENDIAFVAQEIATEEVTLTETELTLGRNTEYQLTAGLSPMDSTDEVTWSSSDEKVAKVDQTGKIQAIAAGTAVITAKAGEKTATCKVTVNIPMTSIYLNKTSIELNSIGDSYQLSASYSPSDAEGTIIWKSEDEGIASVDQTGKVTAVGKGTTTITASCGNVIGTCTVVSKGVSNGSEIVPSPSPQPSLEPKPDNQPANTPKPSLIPQLTTAGTVAQPSRTPMSIDQISKNGGNGANNTVALVKINKIKGLVVKNQKKFKVKVIWKKLTNISGYQIQYAPNKKFKKAKSKTVKSTSVTLKKLKKKKTYFVRVRAYKLVDGKKVYGKWSAVKKVKIKK